MIVKSYSNTIKSQARKKVDMLGGKQHTSTTFRNFYLVTALA